ncbi:hypothetical protein [Nonomuraea angiospora]
MTAFGADAAGNPVFSVLHLSNEIKGLGYRGSFNLLFHYIVQGPVEADRRPISPRHLAWPLSSYGEPFSSPVRGQRITA